jgi:predicted transposase YbfD/YdcC
MIIDFLRIIPDERQQAKVKHPLITVLFTAIVATIAGSNDWEDIQDFVTEKLEWFKKYVEFPYGVPSHDTYERVFRWINPKIFMQSFLDWTNMVSAVVKGSVIAVDGKTMRGTSDAATGKKALHMVSAWCSETGLVLGQVKTSEKSNEITAIPELLDILDVTGCIVTIDAMGTQTKIAEKIVKSKADYVLALKGNQGTLHNEVALFFENAGDEKYQQDHSIKTFREISKGHGRNEVRETFITSDIKWMADAKKDWKNLTSIGMVTYQREESGQNITDKRYFICSIEDNAEKFSYIVRKHWGIESMHWVLDVVFNEDSKRVRKDHGPENLSVLLKFAYNYLKKDTTPRKSLRRKRFKASISMSYLETILNLN